jgi:hypothetical protein
MCEQFNNKLNLDPTDYGARNWWQCEQMRKQYISDRQERRLLKTTMERDMDAIADIQMQLAALREPAATAVALTSQQPPLQNTIRNQVCKLSANCQQFACKFLVVLTLPTLSPPTVTVGQR